MQDGMAINSARQRRAATEDPGNRWGELMAEAQRGNGGAYHRLLGEVDPWLRRFYARRLPPSMVEDAAQEALIAIHSKRHTYEPGRPFRPWLVAVARYKWIDRLRSMKRRQTQELPEDLAVDDHGSAVGSALLLERLLDRLKPAQSAAIRLVKLQGYSVEETAAATGQSASLVKVNIHRGLARLSAMVEAEEDE